MLKDFTIQQWLTFLFGSGVLTIVLQQIYARLSKKIEKNNRKTEAIQLGVQAILRDRLRVEYENAIHAGYASLPDKDNFENMYKQYHNLGVNGVMDGVHDIYMSLPTEPPETPEEVKSP